MNDLNGDLLRERFTAHVRAEAAEDSDAAIAARCRLLLEAVGAA